jgi:hypothetical protein
MLFDSLSHADSPSSARIKATSPKSRNPTGQLSRRTIVALSYVISPARVPSINSIKFTLDRFIGPRAAACSRKRHACWSGRRLPVRERRAWISSWATASEWVSSRDDVLVFHYYEYWNHYHVSPPGFLLSMRSLRRDTRHVRQRFSRKRMREMRSHESRIRKVRFQVSPGLPRTFELCVWREGENRRTNRRTRSRRGCSLCSTFAIAVRLETREAFSRENSILSYLEPSRRGVFKQSYMILPRSADLRRNILRVNAMRP